MQYGHIRIDRKFGYRGHTNQRTRSRSHRDLSDSAYQKLDMVKKEFILQGFSTRTHRDAVRELFGIEGVSRVIVSIAFVNESGVEQIEVQLKSHSHALVIFAGVRNDVTTYQGLYRLHKIGGKLFAVDTGSRTIIFHPKVYLVRGKSIARMIIGSANLTLGGLNNNIEAGMMLEFDLSNSADLAIVEAVESSLMALPEAYPEHVVSITKIAQLDALLRTGRVLDEMAVRPPRPTATANSDGTSDSVPRIKLKVPPIRGTLKKANPPSPPVKDSKKLSKSPGIGAKATAGVELELVWESKALTRRDLTIPDGDGTHATGSINLDKGLLPDSVDHRSYFREDVFPSLAWSATNASGKVEEAVAKVTLVVKGISYGEFDVRIAHSTSTTSTSYKQRNAMTRLSWGPMREFVARPDLIGRTLALFRDKADPSRFVVDVD